MQSTHKKGTRPAKRHARKNSQTLQILRRLAKNKGAMVGLFVALFIIVITLLAPYIAPYDYAKIDILNAYATPSAEHLFGTDDLGRDIFSRVIYGGRYSLRIGFMATALSVILGMTIGSIVGYFGGRVDDTVMRVIDIVQAVPAMLLAVVIAAVLGTGLYETIIALGISQVPNYTRIIRGSFLSIRKMEYLEAAHADNASIFTIITRHMIPNSLAPIIVQSTMGIAGVMMTAANLSFIGLGVPPPAPEWGSLLSGARSFIRDYPHMVIFPGLAIMLTVLSMNLLGDGLRDVLDPKLKN